MSYYEFSENADDIRSPVIRDITAYWRRKARDTGREVPKRSDIAPEDLRGVLPNLMIVEIEHEPLRFRYRLVGTRLVEFNTEDFTGRYLGEIGWPEEQMLIEAYSEVATSAKPVFGHYQVLLSNGGLGRCEFAIWPLSEDGKVVNQCLAAEDYDHRSDQLDLTEFWLPVQSPR